MKVKIITGYKQYKSNQNNCIKYVINSMRTQIQYDIIISFSLHVNKFYLV